MSLRSPNAHGQVSRVILCGNSQVKKNKPTKAILCGNLQEKRAHSSPPTSIEHRAVYSLPQEPLQCGHTVWGIEGFPKNAQIK